LKKPVKYVILLLIIVVIAVIIIVPKLISKREGGDKTRSQTNPQGQEVTSDGLIIKGESFGSEIKTIGTIRANEEVELRSEVARKITGIYFKEGTYVSRGKTLFKLDASDLNAKLKKQRLEERFAELEIERLEPLREKGLVSQQEFDVAENNLEKIQADIELTLVEISKTSISAPFSGIIGLRNVSSGSYVNSSVVLATMQDVSKVKVDFSIPEKYAGLFKPGHDVKFSVEGIVGEFEAKVYAYEPKIENNTRTLVLRALTSNPDRRLLPGNFANVTLKLSEVKDAYLVPTQAIIPKLKGQSVFVLRNGIANSVDIEIGSRTENTVQVVSGLNEGDTLLMTNILRLRQGAKVKLEKVE
jgi:membrane fusion protein (multidrug efflux system)